MLRKGGAPQVGKAIDQEHAPARYCTLQFLSVAFFNRLARLSWSLVGWALPSGGRVLPIPGSVLAD